jgi:pre-60S factor REI1
MRALRVSNSHSTYKSKCLTHCPSHLYRKSFSTPNAYRDHMTSRKHRETLTKKSSPADSPRGKGKLNASAVAASATVGESTSGEQQVPLVFKVPYATQSKESAEGLEETASVRAALPDVSAGPSEPTASTLTTNQSRRSNLALPEDATDEQVQAAIDQKIASSKRIDPSTTCLFCISGPSTSSSSNESTGRFSSLEAALSHMKSAHSFFIPERDYLTDLPGLMGYLADKIAIGHICLYCNGRGRGFASREAAQGHMIDKGHCKIAYDAEEDRLELGDFYDFSSSYPDAEKHKRKMERRKARKEEKLSRAGASKWEVIEEEQEPEEGAADAAPGEAEWEDEDAEEDDEGVSSIASSDEDSSDEEDAPQARYGDNEYELVLPSGVRLGHRSMKRYYDQTMRTTPASSERYAGNENRGSLLARRLIGGREGEADRSGTLVKDRGGNVVRARNRGEAREAKRHVKEFRDMKRREEFKTKVGFRNNNQVSEQCLAGRGGIRADSLTFSHCALPETFPRPLAAMMHRTSDSREIRLRSSSSQDSAILQDSAMYPSHPFCHAFSSVESASPFPRHCFKRHGDARSYFDLVDSCREVGRPILGDGAWSPRFTGPSMVDSNFFVLPSHA